jgi:hypothetical protein
VLLLADAGLLEILYALENGELNHEFMNLTHNVGGGNYEKEKNNCATAF